MTAPYPVTDVIGQGTIDTGDGHHLHWTVAGDPDGHPALVLHGGPGSGSSSRHRAVLDPSAYLIVQFDQRNCGRSTPAAGAPGVDLRTNTTGHLVEDVERVRDAVGVDEWLVIGASWGSTLGLAYAETHPDAVSELLLASVVTTTAAEVEWITRTMGRFFPEQWAAFVEALPPDARDGDLAAAYHRLLMDPDPAVHDPAARAWCTWEDVHVSIARGLRPDPRYDDPTFRLGFARLVTHYFSRAGFLEDGQLLRDAARLGDTPVFLGHGRRDISSPADVPVALAAALPNAELFIAERDGHGGDELTAWMVGVTDRLASSRRRRPGR